MSTTTAPQPPASSAGQKPPARASLKRRALLAGAFSVGGQLVAQLLRVGSNVILSRLLFPEAFGLMAIVRMLNMGLQMISDVGIRSAIVRSERGEERSFLDTAWTLQVMRGVLLMLAGAALAFPVAAFYETPELIPLAMLSALSPLLLGLQSTRLDLLTRDLKSGRVAAIELTSQTAAIAATIAYAYTYRSVWALVAGGVVMTATRTLLSYVATSGMRGPDERPLPHSRLAWDPAAAREIVKLGKWIIVSTLISFLAMRLDVMALGKLVSLETLGVYSIGLTIAGVPFLLMGQITGVVLFPAFSESHRAGHATLARNFRLVLETLLPAALALVLFTAAAAPVFFETLYEERYHAAGWMVQLSMIATWFQLLQQVSSRALLALGDSRGLAVSNAVRLTAGAAGLCLGFAFAGLPGLIIGMAIGTLAGQLETALRLKRQHGLTSARLVSLYSLGGLLAGIVVCGGPHWLAARTGLGHVSLFSLFLGAVAVAPLALTVLRRVRRRTSDGP